MRPITEAEVECLVVQAGGRRAHPDADRRSKRGADFVLGDSVIELKILEDEGLDKPQRQEKVAKLFNEQFPSRPTIVLDRSLLDSDSQHSYDRIVEGPIKSAVSSARRQLEQSRSELGVRRTVLWLINNGNTSLTHEALEQLAARRARNDSKEIDSVVVSGVYIYSDTFDSVFFWRMDCTPIHLDRQFDEFNDLHNAWTSFQMKRMTALMQAPPTYADTKGPVVDISFEIDGVTFVMPTPPMGKASEFFVNGRPRSNSTGITTSPPLATVFAGLSRQEWREFQEHHSAAAKSTTYDDWRRKESEARSESTLKPFIAMPVTYCEWLHWAKQQPQGKGVSIHRYATDLFQEKVLRVIYGAKERKPDSVLPRRYMLLITEVIGQDMAFDVSHLAEICTLPNGKDQINKVWTDKSMFFEHGVAVAAAEAIVRGVDCIYWQKDHTYAWS
jgi:hypothetical protein